MADSGMLRLKRVLCCSTVAKAGPTFIDASGHSAPTILKGILKVFPLNKCSGAVCIMSANDEEVSLPIWNTFQEVVDRAEDRRVEITRMTYRDFMSRSRRAFAVVATGELSPYGNIILQKGFLSAESSSSKPH